MSKEKVKNTTLKTPLYGNCKVQNIDGEHIFNCSWKKQNWYVKRDLAEIIQEDPLIIRLKFTTAGKGNFDDPYYLQERKNLCVCCGSQSNLTKHHIVPRMYRSYLPDDIKDHSAHDILPVCLSCHERYELCADKLKAELLAELNIARPKQAMAVNVKHKKVCLYAAALLKYKDFIPDERYDKMMALIREYYGRDEITTDDLNNAANIEYNTRRVEYIPEGKLVVEAITDMDVFIRRWRKNFVETMEPKHMPKHWNVDRLVK